MLIRNRVVRSYRFLLIMGLLLILAACIAPNSSAPAETLPTPVPGEITIIDPHSRPAMGGGTGVIYLTILNGKDEEVRLIAIESDAAAVSEMHETIDDNGVMRMRPRPEGFEIPPGGHVALEPGGKHIMLIDLKDGLEEGTTFPATLHFDNDTSMEIQVSVAPVGGMDSGDMDHSNMDDGEMENGKMEESMDETMEAEPTKASE